ncbi:MAG TPA: hypothetical protein VGD64_02695 [Acidisarcina sp.]
MEIDNVAPQDKWAMFDLLRDQLSKAFADVPMEQGMAEIDAVVAEERRRWNAARLEAATSLTERNSQEV